MAVTLIAYECIAAGHQPTPQHADKLTVHEGGWAFCAFDALATGHQWRETGGVEMETLMRRGRHAAAPESPIRPTSR
jgi:hypothetical protein